MHALLTNWWGGYFIGGLLAYVTTGVFFLIYWYLLPWQDDD